MYGNPCAVSMKNIHIKAKNSRKRKASFAKLRGVCLICKAIHKYEIVDSPFDDIDGGDDSECAAVADMIVKVSVGKGAKYLMENS